MFRAFHQTILVTQAGKIADVQNTPRKAFTDFLIAKLDGNDIVEYTGSSRNPVEFAVKNGVFPHETQASLKARYIEPEAFLAKYPFQEIAEGVESSMLVHFPGATAALAGLGALAILVRRGEGMLELASLEKPGDYFAPLARAIEFDRSLVEIAEGLAPQIAALIYRHDLVRGLTEHLPDQDYPVYQEPFRSIYLEGYKRYLEHDGGSDVSERWLSEVGVRTEHVKNLNAMLKDFYRSVDGRDCEALFVQKDLLRQITADGIRLKASDSYAPRALETHETADLYIEAGYNWRLSPSLTVYRQPDPHAKASAWAQDMLVIFKSKNSKDSGFWELAGADQCAQGRNILKAIKSSDPKGFELIKNQLPQWTKLACLALGVLTIKEVENVPAAGRDSNLAGDLGL